jgi:hypothetical protein
MATEVTHGYCTEDDLREQLGDLNQRNLSSRQLVRAVNAASRAVDNWTDRRFWADETPVTRLIYPQGDNGYELWLGVDIASSTGLAIATDPGGDGSYTNVFDTTDYRLWPYDATLAGSLYGGWWKLESSGRWRFDVRGINGRHGYLPVQVTARFGWAFCPDPVEQATLLIAAQLFKRKDAPFGVAQFGDIAAVQIVRQDKDVQGLLMPYQRDAAMVA